MPNKEFRVNFLKSGVYHSKVVNEDFLNWLTNQVDVSFISIVENKWDNQC